MSGPSGQGEQPNVEPPTGITDPGGSHNSHGSPNGNVFHIIGTHQGCCCHRPTRLANLTCPGPAQLTDMLSDKQDKFIIRRNAKAPITI